MIRLPVYRRKLRHSGLFVLLFCLLIVCFRMRSMLTELVDTDIAPQYSAQEEVPLGCDSITKLEIVRLVGTGSQKCTYEVKLPSGEHAIAKRCWQESCVRHRWLEKEANITREVHEQYGDQVVRYFGECNMAYTNSKTKFLKKQTRDFSVGFTLVVELGKPMVTSWNMKNTKCFAEFYTKTDIEDFQNIARLFASLSKSPVILKNKHKNDNVYPQQYMTSIGGSNEGRIKLLDLDHQETCTKGETFSNGEDCIFSTALNANCRIMAELVHIPNLNCSLPVNSGSITKPVPRSPNHGINASHAVIECERRHIIANKQSEINQNKDWSKERTAWLKKENKILLGCDDIAKLKVLRLLKAGTLNTDYEVKLPWGEYAIAKRCRTNCKRQKLGEIGDRTRARHKQNGDQVARYFGECNMAYNLTEDIDSKQLMTFSIGFTLVVGGLYKII